MNGFRLSHSITRRRLVCSVCLSFTSLLTAWTGTALDAHSGDSRNSTQTSLPLVEPFRSRGIVAFRTVTGC